MAPAVHGGAGCLREDEHSLGDKAMLGRRQKKGLLGE